MQNRAALGIGYLCVGILVFSLQDAIIKAVSGAYPLTQVVSIRCFVSAPILLAFVHFDGGIRSIVSPEFPALLWRSLLMLAAYTTYYMAFPALPLADAVALYFTVPLFAMALALLSLFSAATYALSMLMARKIGTGVTASVMAFYQNGVYLSGALLLAAFLGATGIHQAEHPSIDFLVRAWVWPTLTDFLLIASCGVIAAIGMTLLTNAYRIAKASVVTSFEYTGMLWAPLWGYLFFGEIPYLTTLAGAGLIVAAGLFALSSPAARENKPE